MAKAKADPAPKPDHIRSLRDLAANFVRAIDRTALEYEGAATSDLTERVACLVALHELANTEAELAKTPNATLRQRLSLLRQVARANPSADWEVRGMTNGELKKRVEYLERLTAAETAAAKADFDNLPDEILAAIHSEAAEIIRERARIAKAQAKAKAQNDARVARYQAKQDPAADETEEEDADVSEIIGDEEAA